jgi:phospholipase A1
MKNTPWMTSALCGRSIVALLALAAACGLAARNAAAEDVQDCLARMLMQSSDNTTVGELRAACAASADAGEDSAGEEPLQPAVGERLKKERSNLLRPFTLMAHKPNYMLPAAYNFHSYDSEPYRQQLGDPALHLRDFEFQFQISLKVPLGINVFDRFDVYAGYTNRSFWQMYNSRISSPFRETNHEPEVWLQFTPGWRLFGFTNSTNAVGIVHQSNGRSGVLSRSWNRVYANMDFERGRFAVSIKPWVRLPESAGSDDNPGITDYQGHYELRTIFKRHGHVISLMSRNNLESGFKRGAVEVGWSFPLWHYRYLKGYIQYFAGYGESLIDYDHKVNRLGLGVALTDWL